MSVAPPWVAGWIGLPYEDKGRGPDAFDCYGLVRGALAAQFRLCLPSYDDTYVAAGDRHSVATAVEAALTNTWAPVVSPQPVAAGDVVILKVGGRPWHCGLVVARNLFLHILEGGTSCIERLDGVQWVRRIEGVYRHEAMR